MVRKFINILVLTGLIIMAGFVLYNGIFSNSEPLYAQEESIKMKVKMSFNNKEVIINMYDFASGLTFIFAAYAKFSVNSTIRAIRDIFF